MKRYALFLGEFYYPSGGWDDFKNSFDTLDEAIKAALKEDTARAPKNWWHIVDLFTGKYAAEGSGKIVKRHDQAPAQSS
jgi:hypothetical protein